MRRQFATLDVFTGRRFTGNPLAVVLETDGLDAATMQAIAREFGHPETVFVFRADDPAHRARLRIFTPARELPFAGHPTVGTAVLLALHDGGDAGRELVLEEPIGPVRCLIESFGVGRGGARFAVPQLPAPAGSASDAAALGLAPADIGFDGLRPSRWSAGVAFTFVPVVGLAAVARCRPDPTRFDATFGEGSAAYVFCGEAAEPDHQFHVRMFAPGMGVPEDPATGAAAAAFAGVVAPRVGNGSHSVTIEQGYEMGRPSLIRLALAVEAGRLVSASIGGDAVVVTEGTIEV